MNYFNTYSLVYKKKIHLNVMAIAVINKLEIYQINIRISFLKGDLDKDIYIDQLEGFVINGQENKFCKLVKSLHGLK